ncbi:MAG: efflux RND transporter permease subunit [Flavobacteriales bacterium]
MYTRSLSFWSLFIVLVVSAWSAWNLQFTTFDYNFENFFPKDDEETSFFLEHRERFSSDNDFVLLGIEAEKSVFEIDFLISLDSLTKAAKNLPYVTEVVSLSNLSERIREPFLGQLFTRNAISIDDTSRIKADSSYVMNHPLWVSNFVSKDAKHTAIFIQTEQYLSKKKCDELAYALRDFQKAFSYCKIHIAGRSIAQLYYIDKMQTELLLFISISAVLLVIFLAFTYKSISGILLPLIVVGLSVLWTLGLMAFLGKSLNLLLTVMPTIIFVVGMSDVVHFKSKYLEELRHGSKKEVAIWLTIKDIGLATFLTTFTTALGFATLLASSVLPVNDFGLYAAIGVTLAYVVTMLTLPAVLFLLPIPKIATNYKMDTWRRHLHQIFKFNFTRGKRVILITILFVFVSMWGISNIRVNSFLLEGLRPGDELRDNFYYFESHFSGARPFEVALEAKLDSIKILDYNSLLLMNEIEDKLAEIFKVETVISPVSIIKSINKSWNGGEYSQYKIPNEEEWNSLKYKLDRFKFSERVKPFITESEKFARISGKTSDIGSHLFYSRYEEFYNWWESHPEKDVLEIKITGSAWLIDRNNEYLAQGMLNGLLIAFVVIAIILWLLMCSFFAMLLSLLPNLLPLLVMAGFMGFVGIDIKISTSIIFSLAFGIAVDDSIHMLSRFKLEQYKGKSYLYALKRANMATGKAIIITTLILCSGFVALMASSFNDTFYIGLLVSLILLLAVLADLFLLPVLLIIVYRVNKKRHSTFGDNRFSNE